MEVPDNTYKWFILQQKKKKFILQQNEYPKSAKHVSFIHPKNKKTRIFFSYIEGDHNTPKILRIFFKILTGQDLTIKLISHFVSHASLNEVTKS